MPYATSVTPNPETSCITKASAGSVFLMSLSASLANAGVMALSFQRSCAVFSCIYSFSWIKLLYWGLVYVMKCKRREELLWDLTMIQEVLRENEIFLGSLSEFCLSLSVILHKWTATQFRLLIQKKRAA